MQPPAEVVKWLNLLVFGEFGAGKTYMLGTAQDHPDTRPLLLLDVEGGVTTLRHRHDIDVKSVRSIDDLVTIHNKLKLAKKPYYRTVGLDSLSELQKLDMSEVMAEMLLRRPDRDPDVPDKREWAKSAEHIRRIVRAYRDLPMHVIMTAHSNVIQDEANSTSYIVPSLPGKLRGEVPGFMDIVGYLHTDVRNDELVRILQLAKTRRVSAKDRTGSLGSSIQSPTIPLLWEMIQDGPTVKEEQS